MTVYQVQTFPRINFALLKETINNDLSTDYTKKSSSARWSHETLRKVIDAKNCRAKRKNSPIPQNRSRCAYTCEYNKPAHVNEAPRMTMCISIYIRIYRHAAIGRSILSSAECTRTRWTWKELVFGVMPGSSEVRNSACFADIRGAAAEDYTSGRFFRGELMNHALDCIQRKLSRRAGPDVSLSHWIYRSVHRGKLSLWILREPDIYST